MALRRFLFILGILTGIGSANATHIVGGEFELIYLSGSTYKLRMIMYFDFINGSPGAFDEAIEASFFSKRTNEFIARTILPFTDSTQVEYFQPECSNGEVVTRRIIYEDEVTLDPADFNDQAGYYVVYQRCCRNYTITNIYSEDPNNGGQHAGQTFYLEFPAVVDENGDPFINSSPQLFPPLSDYGCPNRPYWVDFAGVDTDGDSLVYRMATPLSTQFESAFPPEFRNLPGPYPNVIYRPGFNSFNIMNGNPDLKISQDGFLKVTPQSQGLFVFSVVVDEFRNGKKIGQSRRDFQLLVVDRCPIASPPVVRGKKIGDANYTYENTMSVTFNQSIADEERCIQIEVSDFDSEKSSNFFREDVRVSAIPLNFRGDASSVLPEEVATVLRDGSTFNLDICFPECPFIEDEPFEVGIVAFDDACTLPLSDTLRVTVNIEPPPNQPPFFEEPEVIKTVNEEAGGFYQYEIVGRDLDNHRMYVNYIPLGFEFEDYGMSFDTLLNDPGEVRYMFNWNYDCTQISFDDKTTFEYLMILDDLDQCIFAHPDTFRMSLRINLPENSFPEMYSEDLGSVDDRYFRIERNLPSLLAFNTFSSDTDNDEILVTGEGSNFRFDDFGVSFPDLEGTGNPGIPNTFAWNLLCESFDLAEQDSFRFLLMTEDFDKCNITSRDTITVDLLLSPRDNSPPEIGFQPVSEFIEFDVDSATVQVNTPINLNVVSNDPEADQLDIRLVDVQKLEGGDTDTEFLFEDRTGIGSVASNLIWTPDCSVLGTSGEAAKYRFTFISGDFVCQNEMADTSEFILNITDVPEREEPIAPPNIFTPNGDDKNEYFALEWTDEAGNRVTAIPLDRCVDFFLEIKIFNRWGREVYSSSDRFFRWYGAGMNPGVYYYKVFYTNSEYKGIVSILY